MLTVNAKIKNIYRKKLNWNETTQVDEFSTE